jgi:hypothetical protein
MKTSEKINEIYSALNEFVGCVDDIQKSKKVEIKGVSKKTGKEYKTSYKYADIADVISTIKPALHKCGLAVSQSPSTEIEFINSVACEYVKVTCRIIHKSGQWIEDSMKSSVAANQGGMSNVQAMGSITTYLRRYLATSMLGIAADEDLDGNSVDTSSNNMMQEIEEYRSATTNFFPYIGNMDVVQWIQDYLNNNRGLEQAKKANRIATIENNFCIKAVEIESKIVGISDVLPDVSEKLKGDLYKIQNSRVRFIEEEGKCYASLEKLGAKVKEEIEKLNQG